MTALTVYYRKDPQEFLLVTDYPAKFVEYSDAQQRKTYYFFPGYASMYLLPLLYATRILNNSTPGPYGRLLLLPFLNKVFINLNALT